MRRDGSFGERPWCSRSFAPNFFLSLLPTIHTTPLSLLKNPIWTCRLHTARIHYESPLELHNMQQGCTTVPPHVKLRISDATYSDIKFSLYSKPAPCVQGNLTLRECSLRIKKKKIEKKRTHKQVTHMLIAMLMNVKPRTCIWVTGGEVPRLGGSQRERWPSWGPTTAPWNDITCFQSTVSIWTK